jgi:hypothetical protein
MATDLTNEAYQGYAAPAEARNPFLHSSASHMAFAVGRWLRDTGRPIPRDVRMSRGYTVRANDMLIKWHFDGRCERLK